jgi:phosphoribosylaminoimidazole carboxylase PurE protein
MNSSAPRVGIMMGSDSDWKVMEKALTMLRRFGVGAEVRVLSAHRRPAETAEYAATARARGLRVLIAGAGLAAHLPGVVAAHSVLPVIGVPIAAKMEGLDSLFSIVQMPPGVPVATVGVDRAENAALLAIEILAVADDTLADQLLAYKEEMRAKGQTADENLQARIADAT